MYGSYSRVDLEYSCSQCDKSFESERGLITHQSQIHRKKPLKPIRWTQTDHNGHTTSHSADPYDDIDNPGRQVYYCPRDRAHTSHCSRGFKRHLRSCYKNDGTIDFKKEEGTPDPQVLLYPDSLPPTPDDKDDDRNDLTWPRRRPKRRGRPPTRGQWSLDHREASPSRRRVPRAVAIAGQAPPQPPAVQAEPQVEHAAQIERTHAFLYDFLNMLSKQTGEDFVRHADVFVDFGMTERTQFQRVYEKPALMEKISKRLEDRQLSVWAVSNIEEFLGEYFSGKSEIAKA